MTAEQEQKKIKLDILAKFQTSPIDVYLKLNSRTVKIISSSSPDFLAELAHYQNKQIEYVSIGEKEFAAITALMANKLQAKEKVPSDKKLEVAKETLDYVRAQLETGNISSSDIEMMNQNINGFMKDLVKAPIGIQDKLANFLVKKDYMVNHSLMVLYVTTLLSQKLGWHTDQTYMKINYASLFKDIALDNPFLSKIRTQEEKNFKDLSEKQKLLVLGHPSKAIELLQSLSSIPADLETMVRDHHELPDASGFSRGLAAEKISPLSGAFNVACYFAQEFLEEKPKGKSTGQILDQMALQFNKGNYKLPFVTLVQIIGGEGGKS